MAVSPFRAESPSDARTLQKESSGITPRGTGYNRRVSLRCGRNISFQYVHFSVSIHSEFPRRKKTIVCRVRVCLCGDSSNFREISGERNSANQSGISRRESWRSHRIERSTGSNHSYKRTATGRVLVFVHTSCNVQRMTRPLIEGTSNSLIGSSRQHPCINTIAAPQNDGEFRRYHKSR